MSSMRVFRGIVTEARPGVDADDLDWVTDGRVVTGKQAAEIGLVDEVGDLRLAFARARALADISSASLVKYHRPMQHVGSAYARGSVPQPTAAAPQQQINLMQLNVDVGGLFTDAGFFYLWDAAAWD